MIVRLERLLKNAGRVIPGVCFTYLVEFHLPGAWLDLNVRVCGILNGPEHVHSLWEISYMRPNRVLFQMRAPRCF